MRSIARLTVFTRKSRVERYQIMALLAERVRIGFIEERKIQGGLRGCSRDLSSTGVATDRETQRGADLAHPYVAEMSHAFAQAPLRNGDHIVQVGHAGLLHTIRFTQHDLRWHSTNRGCDRRNGHGRQIGHGAFPRKYDDWPLLVRWSKPVKTDVPSGYFSGQAASASQGSDSPCSCGCLE